MIFPFIVLFSIFFVVLVWFFYPRSGVYAKEKYVGIDFPIPVHGKIDQIVWSGFRLQVQDLKTRKINKVYDSDVWQLSFYRYILSRVQKRPVVYSGVVLVKVGKNVFSHVVKLKNDKEVESFFFQFKNIFLGDSAKKAPIYICRGCGHFQKNCGGGV